MAIAYLHKHGIIHSDVKGDNILISREQSALLGDLGLARFEANPTSEGLRGKGSVPWQSPELLNGESKSYESDMYAFGMTIYEVQVGSLARLYVLLTDSHRRLAETTPCHTMIHWPLELRLS